MFEKEAEEYATKHTYNGDKYTTFEWWYRRNGFQDGAEFGYNKANEWHYVKDGDLPKDEKEVLACLYDNCCWVGYYSQNTDEFERWHFPEFTEDSEQVIAWKEIVLPELKESE